MSALRVSAFGFVAPIWFPVSPGTASAAAAWARALNGYFRVSDRRAFWVLVQELNLGVSEN